MTDPLLRVLSLGAGVQSTCMLLMALAGEFGARPDAAIFADTGWEPGRVYRHLEWLAAEVAPFPIHRVSGGDIRTGAIRKGKARYYVSIPAHVKNRDGTKGMAGRQCTTEFKVVPIKREVRRLMSLRGLRPAAGIVEQWIGISLDEVTRMKDSQVGYIRHRWPLIERRMTRHDCARWLEAHGYPQAPKSSCVGCPYHSDRQWREIQEGDPEEWRQVVEFDRNIRKGGPNGLLLGENYLHRSLVPLDMVDFSTAEDRGQQALFENDCTGYCGT